MTYRPTETHRLHGGLQDIYRFPNGYGASVVSHAYSYGGPSGRYELAVLDQDDNLCYDTEITSDVIGWLADDEVQRLLERIEAL
jgi:hypothetical protein